MIDETKISRLCLFLLRPAHRLARSPATSKPDMGKANHGRGEWKEPQQFVSLAAKPAPDAAGRRHRAAHEPLQQQPALPVGYMAPMSYWPADAMYVRGLQELILNQVHYYFSPENLMRVR